MPLESGVATMVALLIDDVLKRPEFAGVNAPPARTAKAVRRWRVAKATWHSDDQPDSSVQGNRAVGRCLRAWSVDRRGCRGVSPSHACDDARRVHRYLLRAESNKVWKREPRTIRVRSLPESCLPSQCPRGIDFIHMPRRRRVRRNHTRGRADTRRKGPERSRRPDEIRSGSSPRGGLHPSEPVPHA